MLRHKGSKLRLMAYLLRDKFFGEALVYKIANFKECIEAMENLDSLIPKLLDNDDYQGLMNLLNERMVIISQMNEIKQKIDISGPEIEKLKKVWEKTAKVLDKIADKRDSIGTRLKAHRKTVAINKRISY